MSVGLLVNVSCENAKELNARYRETVTLNHLGLMTCGRTIGLAPSWLVMIVSAHRVPRQHP